MTCGDFAPASTGKSQIGLTAQSFATMGKSAASLRNFTRVGKTKLARAVLTRKFNHTVRRIAPGCNHGALKFVSVLIIRAHKRFAVCRKVRLCRAGSRSIQGLLIELSLEGCRISNLGSAVTYALDEPVAITIGGAEPIDARVRWTREGTIGARFSRPLHIAALQELIKLCRGGSEIRRTARA